MSMDDFLNPLERALSSSEKKRKDKAEFIDKLTEELCKFIFEKFPLLNDNTEAKARIKKEAEAAAKEAFESFDSAFVSDDSYLPYEPKKLKPIVQTRAESEKELRESLKKIPEKFHKDFAKFHREDYAHAVKAQQLKKDVHDLIKRSLLSKFEEEIMDFSSKSFLFLDKELFAYSVEPFLDVVFGYVD